jgi:hypothetical protein
MKIEGKAFPVEDQKFFGVINKQINRYVKKPANHTSVDISLTNVNASSKRQMISFMNQLEGLKKLGFEVEINWHYETDDEDVKELGEIFKSMFEIKINLILT